MGWRAWETYEREAHERWRGVPWRERYPLRSLAALALVAAMIGILFWAKLAH